VAVVATVPVLLRLAAAEVAAAAAQGLKCPVVGPGVAAAAPSLEAVQEAVAVVRCQAVGLEVAAEV
jgi:hypothetical protein